jgi:hypothetical protein
VYKIGQKCAFPDLSPAVPKFTNLSCNAGRLHRVCAAKNAVATMCNKGLLRPLRKDFSGGTGHFCMSTSVADAFFPTCLTQLCDHSADRGEFVR